MKESGQMERILRKWQPLARPDCWQTGKYCKKTLEDVFFNLFDTYSIIVHVHREVQVDGNREHVVCVHDDIGGGGVGGLSLPHGVDVEGHVVEAGQDEQEI